MTERYTLLSELGRGGMGVVWKARDEETGQIVALKVLHPAFAVDLDYVARFERELKLARLIHSANVVRVLGFGVRDGAPFLALELVDGPSLRDLLVSRGPYGWDEARPLLAQMAQGLADAHAAGVIHRDLKPSNVLVGSDGVVRIADFGIAKGLDLTRVTGTGTLLGTPAYLAPEGPLDERSDLYSLGIIAYEMLTGAAPFKGTTYQEVIVRHIREAPDLRKLPPESRPVIGWLLAKDPAERPQRASALLPVLYGAGRAPDVDSSSLALVAPPLPAATEERIEETVVLSGSAIAAATTAESISAPPIPSGDDTRASTPPESPRELGQNGLRAEGRTIVMPAVAEGPPAAYSGPLVSTDRLAGPVTPALRNSRRVPVFIEDSPLSQGFAAASAQQASSQISGRAA